MTISHNGSSEMSERMQKKLSDPSIDILPLTLTGHDNDLDRKLSYEEALAKLRQLLAENAELKLTLQQTNDSMKVACQSFAGFRDRSQVDQDEFLKRYNQCREVVLDLRKKLTEKEKIIDTLKKQITQESEMEINFREGQPLRSPANSDETMQQKDDRICQLEEELSNAKSTVNTVMAQNQHAEDVIRAMSQKLKEASANDDVLRTQIRNLQIESQTTVTQHLQDREKDSIIQWLEKEVQTVKEKFSDSQQTINELKSENHKLSSELKQRTENYEVLMSDYHQLLVSSDNEKSDQLSQAMHMKREFELRLDNLTAQLVTAEEVLNRKDNEITQLKNLMKDFEAFKAQAAIFKADFESERQSREEINDEKLQLEEKCRALEARLGEREMQEMQRRHGGTLPPQNRRNAEEVGLYGAAAAIPLQRPQGQPPTPLLPTPQPPVFPPNPIEEFRCPLCQQLSPDLDSLQLHVNECIT